MKRLMRPATCGTKRYAPNSPAVAAPASPSTQIIRMPAMKNSAPHTIRISMVWPKSGSSTNSDTSIINSTSAIEVAGISGRRADSANSHAAITTKAGLADSDAWMLTPIRVIQRGAPNLPRRQERHPDQHDEGRQQKQHMAVEEVKRVEPDPGRYRRARRQRKNEAAQHQRDDRRQQRAINRPPPFAEGGALFTGDHGRPQKAEVGPIGGGGWFPKS